MKILFHIGMGKTGTSSVQQVLQQNPEQLAEQKAEYLGMWFNLIKPSFQGHVGLRDFFQSSDEDIAGFARSFAEILRTRAATNGTELFLFSNEALFGHVHKITPFLSELQAQGIEVDLLAYMRDPHAWLPSAFTQWGIRHKHASGPIQPFGERARTLIHHYDAIQIWHKNFPGLLRLRRHETGIDVVQDFAQAAGITLETGPKRYLERAEDAEVLMRALYNNRIKGEALPERFNRLVINTNRGPVPSASEMAERCFVMEGIDEIVEERRDLFTFIRDTFGFDYLNGSAKERPPVDSAALQTRLLDFLIETTFQQSDRITHLERQLRDLSDEA